jgi:hypothetical protein
VLSPGLVVRWQSLLAGESFGDLTVGAGKASGTGNAGVGVGAVRAHERFAADPDVGRADQVVGGGRIWGRWR